MSQTVEITIVDGGTGNLQSVRRKLEQIGAKAVVSSDPRVVAAAGKLILPGVGHFQRAMSNLAELHLVDALNEAVRTRGVPVLGICLGMQLMARRSEEGDAAGLGWIDADVVRFHVGDAQRYKVPHIGWNSVSLSRETALMKGLPADAEFYFLHAYHLQVDSSADVVAETEYDYRFASVVAKGNVFGAQFHPEKSHGVGETVLRNFAAL